MSDVVDGWVGLVRDLVAGRRVILVGAPLAGSTRRVQQLRRLGADRCLVLANGLGTGDLPDAADADWVVVDVEAVDLMDEFRQVERLLADLPATVVDDLDRFDPDHRALALGTPFLVPRSVAGRDLYGSRRPEWVALEDKTVGDELFDAAGVARPPAEVVVVDRAALLAAAGRLDAGNGTVWAGDARDGFNGGGAFVRWLRPGHSPADVDEAVARLASACDRARVTSFVEGVPLSIHGIVTDDGVAALRPVELVNLRPDRGVAFRYAGCATFYDPPAADRDEMRAAARRVGAVLARRVGYLGAFTVDGVLGADGWVPTEVNPRFGGGLGYTNALFPDLPFDLLHHLLAAGDGGGVRAADLEQEIVPAADRTRWGGGWSTVETRFDHSEKVRVAFDGVGGSCRAAGPGEEADAEILVGPGAEGGFVRMTLDPRRVPAGAPVAPLVVAAFAYTDAALGTGIGPLTPPVDVRTG